MQHEKIGEDQGKITGLRVLPAERDAMIETSFEAKGTLLGASVQEVGTYWSSTRPDGTMYGQGQGIISTDEGDLVMWEGAGLGQRTGAGQGSRWRATLYFRTTSPKFDRLNNSVGLVEYESDEEGNTRSVTYDWR